MEALRLVSSIIGTPCRLGSVLSRSVRLVPRQRAFECPLDPFAEARRGRVTLPDSGSKNRDEHQPMTPR